MNLVNIGKLVQELNKVPEYKGFESSDAIKYLYEKLFVPACDRNSRVALSDFDFEKFELDDISDLQDLSNNVFYRHASAVSSLQERLAQLQPKALPTRFI